VNALRKVGVTYSDADVSGVAAGIAQQGRDIAARLAAAGLQTAPDREIVALVAYLQRLGVDGRRAIEAGLTAPTRAE
jgi:cytochrome c oxidase cbb3-type subunit I/II